MPKNYDYLFRRRHRRYRENRESWEKIRAACRGGEAYLNRALIRHVSENELEFSERLARACYFNYPRKVARMITQFVLSVEPQRANVSAELVEDFSRTGLRTNEVMRQFSTLLNLYGSAALVVEMPYFEGEVDYERRRRERLRPAVRAVSPLDVVDWNEHADGRLDWILLEEKDEISPDAFSPATPRLRRRLLTREEEYVFERTFATGEVKLVGRSAHHLGMVPAVYAAEADGFGLGFGNQFEDIVRISDAILNNESEAQMNIIKQTFGLLVISDSFARSGRNVPAAGTAGTPEKFSHVIARSAAIWESADERGISRYISPSGADTEAIRETNRNLKRELFDLVGMSLASPTREAQSAESKAWDYHQVKQFLSSRVDILEQAEKQCWIILHEFDRTIPVPEISYNREFAVSDLKESMESLVGLKELSTGPLYQRELAHTALFLLEKIRKLTTERRAALLAEIDRAEDSPHA